MRIATYPALAVLAILVGLGIGYLLWGSQAGISPSRSSNSGPS